MIENKQQIKQIEERIGFLFENDLLLEIFKVGKIKSIDSGEVIMAPGEEISFIPLIIEGAIKVSKENEEGDELLLYYIESSDTCAMTLQCCVRKSKSSIKATAMENSLLLIIPLQYMEDWMNRYASWRQYILENYHVRITELIETVGAIAFMRLDERLDKYLKDQAKLLGSLDINHTHQQIAEDLHSSRVVISRLLKQMESKGLITLGRNKVILKEF